MAVIRKDDKPHDLRHILVGDGRGRLGVVEDGGGRRGTAENSGKQRKTAGDGIGRPGTAGDGGGRSFTQMCGASSRKDRTGRQNAVRPRL